MNTFLIHILVTSFLGLALQNANADGIVGGRLTLGHEVREFAPCGNPSELWLQSSPENLSLLQSRYQGLVHEPYGSAYAELSGVIGANEGTVGFAADYDGVFSFDNVAGIEEWLPSSCNGPQKFRRVKHVWVLECPHKKPIVVATESNGAWLFRPEGTLRLERSADDETPVFANSDIKVRINGDSGTIIEGGVESATCTNNRRQAIWEQSKLNGADFRAVGNEPGWVLEILGQGHVVFVANYGEHRVEVPLPDPVTDTEARITHWDAGVLAVEIAGQNCNDTMSGESYEARVTVQWNGRRFQGCGRALH